MTRELLRSHSSVRKYTGEQISKEQVIDMIETAQMAASSHFVQAYSVIWVTDEEKKAKLGELSKNEFQFQTAGGSFLFCVDFKRLHEAGKKNGVEIVVDSAENLLVGITDVALFAQNFVIAAEAEGYGICYIGGARTSAKEISELFELPEYVFLMFSLTRSGFSRRNFMSSIMITSLLMEIWSLCAEGHRDLKLFHVKHQSGKPFGNSALTMV